ncbi:MAG: 8-oxo-dGTP pyrophosphatase MutT (NUDIX family) [Cognaticolwellia sp.]|jgi:8-oxo-dGTP pyrophosphatase MutT (NUDIX family)
MSPMPRPAATVALLRDRDGALQVFLVKRSSRSPFMPSAYVFPGGRVDAADGACPVEGGGLDRVRMGETFGAPALAYQVAAVRETYEECGVLLAEGPPQDLLRTQLQGGEISFAAAARQAGWVVDAERLIYFAWWITPEGESRRYDTRFFAAWVEEGDEAGHDDFETVDSGWETPQIWLERFDAGQVILAPPTWRSLFELSAFGNAKQAIRALSSKTVVPIEPRSVQSEDGFTVLLPGDVDYPSETPVQGPTRHTLRAGRWFISR